MGSLDCNSGWTFGTFRQLMSETEFRNMQLAMFPNTCPWNSYQHYYLETLNRIRQWEKNHEIKQEDLPLI